MKKKLTVLVIGLSLILLTSCEKSENKDSRKWCSNKACYDYELKLELGLKELENKEKENVRKYNLKVKEIELEEMKVKSNLISNKIEGNQSEFDNEEKEEKLKVINN